MQIGKIVLSAPAALAPMAGITDWPFRILCKEQGVGLLVSEMISAKGLLYNNKKTFEMLEIAAQERPVAIQLFGSEPLEMAKAAKIVQSCGADLIDVNMGCPVPKVVNNGEGSALMKAPDKVYALLAAMREVLDIPLTVKIRSGFDENCINAVQIAELAERAGVDALAVHARTRRQMYMGRADWQVIKQVVQSIKIPVWGNGDVNSPDAALRMMAETGCAGVMVGRAAEGNPWIFREIIAALQGHTVSTISLEERFAMIHRHLELLIVCKGEKIAVQEMRRHAAAYIKGLPFATGQRALFNNTTDAAVFHKLLEKYQQELRNFDGFSS